MRLLFISFFLRSNSACNSITAVAVNAVSFFLFNLLEVGDATTDAMCKQLALFRAELNSFHTKTFTYSLHLLLALIYYFIAALCYFVLTMRILLLKSKVIDLKYLHFKSALNRVHSCLFNERVFLRKFKEKMYYSNKSQ